MDNHLSPQNATTSFHKHQPHRNTRLSRCLLNCGCYLLAGVLKFLCTFLLLLSFTALISWLLFHPRQLDFYASDDASLSAFNFSHSRLSFNLSLHLTAANPNRYFAVSCDAIRADAVFLGRTLATAEIQPFFLEAMNATQIGPVVFHGNSGNLLPGSKERSDYEMQKSNGEFEIDVKLHLKVRFMMGLFKIGRLKSKFECNLKVPFDLQGDANLSTTYRFMSTKCYFDL